MKNMTPRVPPGVWERRRVEAFLLAQEESTIEPPCGDDREIVEPPCEVKEEPTVEPPCAVDKVTVEPPYPDEEIPVEPPYPPDSEQTPQSLKVKSPGGVILIESPCLKEEVELEQPCPRVEKETPVEPPCGVKVKVDKASRNGPSKSSEMNPDNDILNQEMEKEVPTSRSSRKFVSGIKRCDWRPRTLKSDHNSQNGRKANESKSEEDPHLDHLDDIPEPPEE